MKLILKQTVIDKMMTAYHDAKRNMRECEAFVLSQREFDEFRSDMRSAATCVARCTTQAWRTGHVALTQAPPSVRPTSQPGSLTCATRQRLATVAVCTASA